MGNVIGVDTSYTGNPVSFVAANGGTMKSVSVPLTYSQDLHGYDHPWPAGGGKNKAKLSADNVGSNQKSTVEYSDSGATITATGTYGRYGWLIPVTVGETYTLSMVLQASNQGAGYAMWVTLGSADGVWGSGSAGYIWTLTTTSTAPESKTFTFTASTATLFVGAYASTTATDGSLTISSLQLELGSAATSWTPYENICPISGRTGLSVYVSPTQDVADATTYAVDWTTQAGTVYGGTLDVVTGVLTVDRAMYTFDGSEAWTASATPHRFSTNLSYLPHPIATQPMTQGATQNVLTSVFGECVYTNADGVGYVVYQSNVNRFVVNEYAATTVNDIKAMVTGMQFCYELATPQTFQLTPNHIAALVGQNYIWANNNQTLSVVLTAPMTGFAGWLIKCVTNGTPVEIPLKYMRAETYTVTPDQRMEWSAERDVTGVLHRETVQNLPPKIEFNTPLMTNADINALNSIIKAAFTSYLQRNITIQFYDPERDQYWEWDCYMPDVHYQIRNADTTNHVINYEELRYAFIGY